MFKEMILKRLRIIQELRGEFLSIKETYEGMLEEDVDYQEMVAEEQKAKEQKVERKAKILVRESYKDVLDQLKTKRQELKENHEALGQELVEYYRESGALEIEDEGGNIKRLKFSARLVN